MKPCAILPALTVLAGMIGAQTIAPKPGSIEGVVTSSLTNSPVKNATVVLRHTSGHSTESNQITSTDATGHFHFDPLEPGSYMVTGHREGFQPSSASTGGVTVAEEQHVQDIGLKLAPVATIRGHILDDDGDPIVRADVEVLRYFYGSGRKRLNRVTDAQSNDLGEFEVSNLPGGRYYVQVSVRSSFNIPPRTHWSHPEEAYPPTFYPNGSDTAEASAIDAAPGAQVSNIDFRLHKTLAYHVRGKVIDEVLDPDTYRRVMVQSPISNQAREIAESRLQNDGTFDLSSLMPGSYTLIYMRFTSGKFYNLVQTVRISDADVNGVVLARRPAIELTGTLTTEGSPPERLDIQVTLDPIHGNREPVVGLFSTDGKLAMADLSPEAYALQINRVPAGKYVKSVRFGDQDLGKGEIDLTGRSGAELNIVLGADGGEVDGTVQTGTGQPATSPAVTIVPAQEQEGLRDLFQRVFTDSAGNFHIKDVAPGEYRVFAWERDPEAAPVSAEFQKPFESRGVSVTVRPKDKASVQLTLITNEEIDQERGKLP